MINMVSSELHMICGADLNKTEGANQESSLLTKRKTDVKEIKAIVQGTKMNKRVIKKDSKKRRRETYG